MSFEALLKVLGFRIKDDDLIDQIDNEKEYVLDAILNLSTVESILQNANVTSTNGGDDQATTTHYLCTKAFDLRHVGRNKAVPRRVHIAGNRTRHDVVNVLLAWC